MIGAKLMMIIVITRSILSVLQQRAQVQNHRYNCGYKHLTYTAKTDFLEQISNANLRFFIHPNFAFLSGPNKVDLRGISKLIEVK